MSRLELNSVSDLVALRAYVLEQQTHSWEAYSKNPTEKNKQEHSLFFSRRETIENLLEDILLQINP